MNKLDTFNLEDSQASSTKNHFLAWDKEYTHLKWGGPAPIRDIQAYLLLGSTVLDAGSGNGRYLGELARHYNAVGIDISITALNGSRARLSRSGRFAEHLGASILDLPFKTHTFDGILCYGVLQHLFKKERESAVEEFSSILRKGGFFFFEAFGYKDMRCGGEPSIHCEERTFSRQNGIIYHYFTKEEVRTLFKGFEIMELEDVIKEKNFKGKVYRRHLIKGIFRKT
ncbi:peptidoglycan-binding protein LysM [Methanosarcina sp. A14]|uniref:LysM protein n=1 Tax=Methanosarcina barkeri MS TaxID=1434108 RepID=A0A0E3QRL9_METBA|nr:MULTISPECIES: class I SAM-dependent methyltransferase [Methanosarcina]AKB53453.1 LysM protein [Methanosarcina barkeri MS]OED08485.1 peptidoglycan-binding protein LysM [Methanosarcina sp. A14]